MKKHSLSENILFCLTASFVSSVWQYEMYFGETANMLLSYGSLLLTAVVWTVTAFSEGRVKRIGFAVFTLLFYILPQILIIYAEKSDYNRVLQAASQLCGLFTRSVVFGNSVIFPAASCGVFLTVFFVGYIFAGKKNNLSEEILSENIAERESQDK